MGGYRIAIIGAGPAGCTLARLLSKTSCEVTIFEAEKSLDVRSQGGTLDLRERGGLFAIKEAELYEDFLKYARYDGEFLIIGDKNIKAYVKSSGNNSIGIARPEIDRLQLRQLLLDCLPKGIIQWDHKVQRVDHDGTSWKLQFVSQEPQGGYDLIVGADGAWSKARAALTDTKPHYSGVSGVWYTVSQVEKKHPDLYSLVKRGSVFSYSDGKSLALQYMSDGSLICGASGVRPEKWWNEQGLSMDDPQKIKAALLEEYKDWHPMHKKSIEVADTDHIMPRSLYMMPIGATFEHRSGLTVLGDAAHVMTPYAGLGANLAMADATYLSRAIKKAIQAGGTPEALDLEVNGFEKDMFLRMTEAQETTWGNTVDMLFTPGAPRTSIGSYVGRMAAAEVSGPLKPIVRWGIKTFYFLLRLFY